MNQKLHAALVSVAQIWLPAAGTLYFTLAQIWHLPDAEQVLGTITAVDTFLGVGLQLKKPAPDGHLIVDESDSKIIYGVEPKIPPEEMKDKPSITLKVVKTDDPTKNGLPAAPHPA
jgi:hypothetical protein